MSLYTSDSKKVVETISYSGDFRDVLLPGETITSQSVIVTVFSGTDTNPSNLLYLGISVHAGWIEQKIRLGIPGNIYRIDFIIGTSLSNTYDKVTRLAILPEEGEAIPKFTNVYLTSNLYPYNIGPEKIQSYFSLSLGSMWYQPSWNDAVKSSFLLQSGNLFVTQITYNIPHEDIKSAFTPNSGVLTLVVIYYTNYGYESIKNGFALISGNLYQSQVTYNLKHEDIKSAFALVSGTLI